MARRMRGAFQRITLVHTREVAAKYSDRRPQFPSCFDRLSMRE
jgi:hypothetical protein